MPTAVIVDYDAAWPRIAAQLLSEVRAPFSGFAGAAEFRYEHIGSTAVPDAEELLALEGIGWDGDLDAMRDDPPEQI